MKDQQYIDFSHLVRARYSTRDFAERDISPAVLAEILGDARYAPSYSNTRGYQLAIATGDTRAELIKRYLAEYDAMTEARENGVDPDIDGDYNIFTRYPDELRERQIAVGVGLYQHLGIARDDRAGRERQMRKNLAAFGAPVVGLLFIRRDFLPQAAVDAGLMLQTLFLAAAARGVDSCGLGVLAGWRRPADALFDVDPNYALVTGFALGYGTDAHVNEFRAAHPPITQLKLRS